MNKIYFIFFVKSIDFIFLFVYNIDYKLLQGRVVVARWAHNPKVVGSNPSPAILFYEII